MLPKFELIHTDDGSHTVRDTELGVTYHSTHGAITESTHVFIQHGLEYISQDLRPLRILEVGFGTGLNALLAYLFAEEHKYQIEYTALEPFPLPDSVTSRLNYADILEKPALADVFSSMHHQPAGEIKTYGRHLKLSVLSVDLDRHVSATPYNLVFFDAFGPSAAPELWSLPALTTLKALLSGGAVLVTFCAQGQFKRNLKSLGFKVQSLPGPPGKREMTRATLAWGV